MDEGTDRGRTFHGIRQPNVQREHGTLTGTTDKHKEESSWNNPCSTFQMNGKLLVGSEVIIERTDIETVEEYTDKEEKIGETRYDEGLLRGVHSGMLRIIESDEQIRADTNKLPEKDTSGRCSWPQPVRACSW